MVFILVRYVGIVHQPWALEYALSYAAELKYAFPSRTRAPGILEQRS